MNKRLLPAISIGITVILIGTLAYAADRRKKTNSVVLPNDNIREEEALTNELLNAIEHKDHKGKDKVNTDKKSDGNTLNTPDEIDGVKSLNDIKVRK